MQIKPFVPAGCWGILVTVLSLLPGGGSFPLDFLNFLMVDKLAHTGFYAGLSFLIAYGFLRSGNLNRPRKWTSVGIAALLGLVLEGLQATVTTQRHFEFLDILANIIGSFLGVVCLQLLFKKK